MAVGAAAVGVGLDGLELTAPQVAAAGPLLNDQMATDDAWAAFLGPLDLMWTTMPKLWSQGPFLGNGNLGAMLFQPTGGQLQFLLGHGWVQDHRPQFGPLFGLARLPVGHMTIQTVGTITAIDWRQDLWNAQVYGTVTTTAGQLYLQALVHDQMDVLAIRVLPSGGETGFKLVYNPEAAVSPRINFHPAPAGYTANPPAQLSSSGSIQLAVQPMTAGGQTVTAWQDVSQPDGSTIRYVSLAHSFPDLGAQTTAISLVQGALAQGWDGFQLSHRTGWHAFYKRSFASVPDGRIEAFYWIQLFKMNCVSRLTSPLLSTSGPWQVQTQRWTNVWWDANIQTEYWILQTSNHQEDLDSLAARFSDPNVQQNFVDQVRPQYQSDSAGSWRETDGRGASGTILFIPGETATPPWETSAGMEIGDLPFALSNVWLSYLYTLDDNLGRNTLFPLLRRAINYYLHFATKDASGRIHLAATYLPESSYHADCTYDLILFRWGAQTLLDLCQRLGITDPLIPRWQDAVQNLPPPATGNNTYLYRMPVYPLYLVTWDQGAASQAVITSMANGSGANGFQNAWVSSCAALAHMGDRALSVLQSLLTTFILPNTMYAEANGTAPVIESALAAANCVHDMLLQSWGDIIRVFPAVPTAWSNAVFHNWRTQGNFLVSAARSGGNTQFVRVLSQSGAPCRLRLGFAGTPAYQVSSGRQLTITQVDAQTIQIDLQKGEEVVLYPVGTSPDLAIAPVAAGAYRWGINNGGPGPLAPPPPSQACTDHPSPSNVSGIGGGGQATVTWSPPAGGCTPATAYYVYAYGADGTTQNQETTSASATVTGLTSGQFYTFIVTAWDGSAWSAWSAWSPWVAIS